MCVLLNIVQMLCHINLASDEIHQQINFIDRCNYFEIEIIKSDVCHNPYLDAWNDSC